MDVVCFGKFDGRWNVLRSDPEGVVDGGSWIWGVYGEGDVIAAVNGVSRE